MQKVKINANEIVMVAMGDITPYHKNARNNAKTVKGLVQAIKDYGFNSPLLLDKNNVIIAGHARYKAALKLDMVEVPVVYAKDLTDKQVKQFRIADNKLSEFATWDNDLLEFEIREIGSNEFMDTFDLDFNIEFADEQKVDYFNPSDNQNLQGYSTKNSESSKSDNVVSNAPNNMVYQKETPQNESSAPSYNVTKKDIVEAEEEDFERVENNVQKQAVEQKVELICPHCHEDFEIDINVFLKKFGLTKGRLKQMLDEVED